MRPALNGPSGFTYELYAGIAPLALAVASAPLHSDRSRTARNQGGRPTRGSKVTVATDWSALRRAMALSAGNASCAGAELSSGSAAAAPGCTAAAGREKLAPSSATVTTAIARP